MKRLSTLALTASLIAFATGTANANETRIRQANQNVVVQGSGGSPLLFTTTGYLNDDILIFNGFGIPVVQGRIRHLRSHPHVRAVVRHTGGQTSLRWRLPSGGMDGGIVYIVRNGAVIDADPVVVLP